MSDLLQVSDLEKAKLHDTFHSEVITGKVGGLAGGADIDHTTNAVTGQVQTTLPVILRGIGFTRVGTFASGATLTDGRQTLLFDDDGQEYGWTGAFPKTVTASSTPTETGGIANGAWVSRYDPITRVQAREALRRTYADAGLTLVGGSFEAGGTLTSVNDVLLQESSGEAYGWGGTFPKVATSGSNPSVGWCGKSNVGKSNKVYAESFLLDTDIDFTAAIKRGIAFCVANNICSLHLRSDELLISSPIGDCPVSLISDSQTTLKYTNTTMGGSANFIVFKQGIKLVKGIVFDGQVSTSENTYNEDPSSWSAANHNTWFGCQGPIISIASGFTVIDCEFKNMYRAGLYVTGCSDFKLVGISTRRNRGVFGDGIFIGNGCSKFSVINPNAYDFTRGGLVVDLGCYDFNISGNVAEYGHDWSALYGGTEYAAGLWIEKSTRGTVVGGKIFNTGYYGVILALEKEGFIPSNFLDFMTLSVSDTVIKTATVGMNCRSADGVFGRISLSNVDSSVDSGCVGMLLRGHPNLNVDVIGGSSTVYGATAGACIAVGGLGTNGVQPIYTLNNVSLGHTNASGAADAKARLSSADVGDVCVYTITEYDFSLTLHGLRTLSPYYEILIGLRTARITPTYHTPEINLSRIRDKVYYIDQSSDFKPKFRANNVVFSQGSINCVDFNIDRCESEGSLSLYFNSLFKFGYNQISNTNFKSPANNVHYVGGAPAIALTPAFMLDSCRFSGDLSGSNSYLVDIRAVNAGGNRIGWVHRDNIFNNTGSNGAGSAAVSCLLGDYNSIAYKYSNVFDTTITNVLKTSGGVVTDPTSVNLGVRENLVLAG